MIKNIDEHLKVISENAIDFISEEELRLKLDISIKQKKPLKIKVGFDPTARDIHLGHTVLLRKLRKIQDLGHDVYFIIGDFTARIGDPSGKNELRPLLAREEIEDNAKTYTSQVFKILNKEKTKVVFNSIWYKDMDASYFISLLSRYTLARMIERDDFSRRIKQNKPLSLQELVYPIVQGYDSVKIEADIEFGGTDQKFNLIVGRHLQESFGQKPQVVITLPLLRGLDGKNKMSKSLGNYIGITESPRSMFGKIMSIPDELMQEYFSLLTDIEAEEIKSMHPKEAKLLLAQTLVEYYHSSSAAKEEKEFFENTFSKRETPHGDSLLGIPVYVSSKESIDLIGVLYETKLVKSKHEARRLLEQKSISYNSVPLREQELNLNDKDEIIIQVGKRRFIRIIHKGN